MKVCLITGKSGVVFEELDTTQDIIRQIAARLGSVPQNITIERMEISCQNFDIFRSINSSSDIITGIDFSSGEPVICGAYVVAHYDSNRGVCRGLNVYEESVLMNAANKSGVICTFNQAPAIAEQRKHEEAIRTYSDKWYQIDREMFRIALNAAIDQIISEYSKNKRRVYRDIFEKHPALKRQAILNPLLHDYLYISGYTNSDIEELIKNA